MSDYENAAPENPGAARPTGVIPSGRPPQQGRPLSQLQGWIIIGLLALTLVVGILGLVLQSSPMSFGAGGGGANFVPNESFQSAPDSTESARPFQSTPSGNAQASPSSSRRASY